MTEATRESITFTIKMPKDLHDSWKQLEKLYEFDFHEYAEDVLVSFLEEKFKEMKKEFH